MKRKGKYLFFISQINRDGNGTEPINLVAHYSPDEKMKLYRLSITEDTWIATDRMNYFVVKLI